MLLYIYSMFTLMLSSYIPPHKAVLFYQAAQKAKQAGTVWNCHITVHLESIGISPKAASKHIKDSLQRLNKYHQRHNMSFSYGWVLENGPTKGVHAHILIHRPIDMSMHFMTYRWAVLRRFQLPNMKGVLKIKKIQSWGGFDTNYSAVLSYVLKGIRKGTEHKLKMAFPAFNRKASNEGKIYGQRIGYSLP